MLTCVCLLAEEAHRLELLKEGIGGAKLLDGRLGAGHLDDDHVAHLVTVVLVPARTVL